MVLFVLHVELQLRSKYQKMKYFEADCLFGIVKYILKPWLAIIYTLVRTKLIKTFSCHEILASSWNDSRSPPLTARHL